MTGPARCRPGASLGPLLVASLLLAGCAAGDRSGPALHGAAPDGRAAPGAEAVATADGAARPRPAPARGAPTRLAQQLLSRCSAVAVARVESVRPAGRGLLVLRLRALEVLTGEVGFGQELVVVTYSGDFEAGGRELVHLASLGAGGRYELAHRVASDDPHLDAKIAATRRTLALGAVRDPAERARATIDWLVACVAAPDPWLPRYARDELEFLAAAHPDLFDPGSVAALREAAARCRDAAVAADVETVASRLAESSGTRPPSPQEAPSPP